MSSAPRPPAPRGMLGVTPISSTTSPSAQPPSAPECAVPCAHPRVQIVAREEDSEFVECLECREVFEAREFGDMAIEEKIEDEEAE